LTRLPFAVAAVVSASALPSASLAAHAPNLAALLRRTLGLGGSTALTSNLRVEARPVLFFDSLAALASNLTSLFSGTLGLSGLAAFAAYLAALLRRTLGLSGFSAPPPNFAALLWGTLGLSGLAAFAAYLAALLRRTLGLGGFAALFTGVSGAHARFPVIFIQPFGNHLPGSILTAD
jgi:hypothetical protein